MSAVLIPAAVRYLCTYGSVGVFRLVDDLLKMPEVKAALGLKHAPPGTDAWWRAYHAVLDVVRTLQAKGLVKYDASMGVVNWLGAKCV